MERKYGKIYTALTICSPFDSEKACHAHFNKAICEYGDEFIRKLKLEINEALLDESWSWKVACKEVNFCTYGENDTEEESFYFVRKLFWKSLFGLKNESLIFPNLAKALNLFNPRANISKESNVSFLNSMFLDKEIDYDSLKDEYNQALNLKGFNWQQFSDDCGLYLDSSTLSEYEIKEHVISILDIIAIG